MGKETVKIGLIGLGTIGSGFAALLKRNKSYISENSGINLELSKVADKDRAKLEAQGFSEELIAGDIREVTENPDLDIVVELIGGLEPAKTFITEALKNGKHIVTANKDLIAMHGKELLNLASEKGLNIYYEASVGGGIPLIRPLKHSLAVDKIYRLVGIVNGTTNYIFTRMAQDNLGLSDALIEAQKLGFAEPDPTNDIEGFDAAYKLMIMSSLAFGSIVERDKLYVEGIGKVTYEDIDYAREIGYAIKLLAIGEKLPEGLALRVHPTLVPFEHPLASVQNELNAVYIEGDAVGEVMLYGRGAGAMPTATSVLADVTEAARSVIFRPNAGVIESFSSQLPLIPIEEMNTRFYLRFLADDRPGVFAALANAFGDEEVSLDMVIQKRRVGNTAEIVLVTHEVKEAAFRKALDKVMSIEAIKPEPSMIRLLS